MEKAVVVAVEVAVVETVSETDGIAVEEAETAAGKATVETVAVDVPAVAMTNRSVNSMRTLLVERKNAENKNRYS